MKRDAIEKIANAILYEGYMLYPYRPSAVKNQQRWNFGTLYPPQFEEVRHGTERSTMHVECLLATSDQGAVPTVSARVRCLQMLPANGNGWNQTSERSSEFNFSAPSRNAFSFPGVEASVQFAAEPLGGGVSKLVLDLSNDTPVDPSITRDDALLHSLLGAHIVLSAEKGGFISLLDPPDDQRNAVAGCRNVGCFPVLAGEQGQRDVLLCSPIILYDYPQIAPESAGDFFDGTEMDEMLTLRVMTLTAEEKDEMRSSDDRVRTLLERTEATAREQLARTHGIIRSFRPVNE